MNYKNKATYQYVEETHGRGMFFFTDCCNNRMYDIRNNLMLYHGCLCPGCLYKAIKLFCILEELKKQTRLWKKNKARITSENIFNHNWNYYFVLTFYHYNYDFMYVYR